MIKVKINMNRPRPPERIIVGIDPGVLFEGETMESCLERGEFIFEMPYKDYKKIVQGSKESAL